MTDKLTDQVADLNVEEQQPRTNAIADQNSRNLIPPSQRKNRRDSLINYTTNEAFDTIISKKSKSKHSMSSFGRSNNRMRDEDADRDLRSSAACLNLQDNSSEVVYKNGRKSTLAKTLDLMATRVSVMENIDERRLRQSYLQNLNTTGNLLGKNSALSPLTAASITTSNDNVGYNLTNAEEYNQDESEINDQYYENYRRGSEEQENLHRVSSVVSNKEERLGGSLIKQASALSNEELVYERRKDPSIRKRPTSAGEYAPLKNSRHSNLNEDELRCLSDTELDTMEIELTTLNDNLICQY